MVLQLWLNEGFATWVGWLAIDHLYPRQYIYALKLTKLTLF
jgi:aminopeptidase N